MILLDTNVVARTTQKGHLHHRAALDAVAFLRRSQGEIPVVSPQVLIKFYAISTRTLTNGLGLTAEQALAEIELIKQRYPVLPEQPTIFGQLELLITKYKPTNRRVYDMRHVAFMLVHQIPRILTFNDQNFTGFTEIVTLNPFDVLKIPRV